MPESTLRGDLPFWSFASAGRVVFGWGTIARLPAELPRGTKSVLVITDEQLTQAGLVGEVVAHLRRAHVACEVFTQGRPEPTIDLCLAAVAFAKKQRVDALIGFGGGSNLDLAKMVNVLLTHGGQPQDYFGFDRIPGPARPLVALPTTAGTGSEVSHSAVLTDAAQKVKVSTLSPWLRPTVAIVDPSLTVTCPPHVTAESGADALVHAMEAWLATPFTDLALQPGESFPYCGKNPLCDGLAQQAIRLIGENLPRVVAEPGDQAARTGMSLAALLAGQAFSNSGVAAVHALEYPIGGAVHVSHGGGNGLLLPHVLRYLIPLRGTEILTAARGLGVVTNEVSPAAAIDAIQEFLRKIGIPQRLRDLGVTPAQLPGFAEKSHEIRRLMRLTPGSPSVEHLRRVLEAAW